MWRNSGRGSLRFVTSLWQGGGKNVSKIAWYTLWTAPIIEVTSAVYVHHNRKLDFTGESKISVFCMNSKNKYLCVVTHDLYPLSRTVTIWFSIWFRNRFHLSSPGVFLLCWMPFFTVNIINAICLRYDLSGLQENRICQIDPWLLSFLVWLGYINSFLNPIIYTIFNAEFRRAFRKILRKLFNGFSCLRLKWRSDEEHEERYYGNP